MTKGDNTNVRDRPYIPSTTLLCEGIKIAHVKISAMLDKRPYN